MEPYLCILALFVVVTLGTLFWGFQSFLDLKEIAKKLEEGLEDLYRQGKEQKKLLKQIAEQTKEGMSQVSAPAVLETEKSEAAPAPNVIEYMDEVLPVELIEPTERVEPSVADMPRRKPKKRPKIESQAALVSATATEPSAEQPNRGLSKFESSALDVMQKIWRWIAVGEQNEPGVSLEYAIASTWLLRLGVLILVLSMGFFLKYSIEHDFIGAKARVGLTILAGLSMLVFGTRLLGKLYHVFGLGMLGAGIATLYFAIFAAFNFHHLIPVGLAFGLMFLITVCAGVFAVRFNSPLVAIIGILGGYGTPVMLSTGVVNFPGLFSYVLLLGLGVLGISYKRKWHLLNYLSFVCTYVLFFGAMRAYRVEHFWQVMPFLAGFFVLFSTMVFVFNIFQRARSSLLDALFLLVNAGMFFACSYVLIHEAYTYRHVGIVTIAVAAFYIAHVWYCLARRILDRELLFTFVGLACFFLASTIPLVLTDKWITVSWALQAFVMLWLAGKLQSAFLKHLAYLLYLLVVSRLALFDLAQHYSGRPTLTPGSSEFYWLILERLVAFGVPIASLFGAYRLLKKPVAPTSLAVDEAHDMKSVVQDNWALLTLILLGVGLGFLFLHLELNHSLGQLFPPVKLPVLTMLWVGLGCFFMSQLLKTGTAIWMVLTGIVCVLMLVKLCLFDLASWGFELQSCLYLGEHARFRGIGYGLSRELPYSFLDAGMRFIDFGVLIAFFFGTYRLVRPHKEALPLTGLTGGLALGLLFCYLSLEAHTVLYAYLRGAEAGGVSIVWTLFAISCLLVGIWRRQRVLRYVALTLFTVVGIKVLFFDLAELDKLYRIIAFMILGVLVLAGSFIYLKYRATFADSDTVADHDTPDPSAASPASMLDSLRASQDKADPSSEEKSS